MTKLGDIPLFFFLPLFLVNKLDAKNRHYNDTEPTQPKPQRAIRQDFSNVKHYAPSKYSSVGHLSSIQMIVLVMSALALSLVEAIPLCMCVE